MDAHHRCDPVAGPDDAGRRALGPEILLVAGSDCLVLECTYSPHGHYVAGGYAQALAYAAELRGLVAETTETVVVGPEGVVPAPGRTVTAVGPASVVPATHVRQLVRDWNS